MSKLRIFRTDMIVSASDAPKENYKLLGFDESTLTAIFARLNTPALEKSISLVAFHDLVKDLRSDEEFAEIGHNQFSDRKFS